MSNSLYVKPAKKVYKKPGDKPVRRSRTAIPGNPRPSMGLSPHGELKNVDSSGTLSLDNNGVGSGHTALINGLIPGVERYQRVGRRVTAKAINVRCYVYTSAASPAVIDDLFRIAVIFDEQPATVLPTASSLWSQVTSAGVVSTNMLSFNNRDNSMRFKTLRTHTVQINAEQQASETYQGRIYWEWDIPCNFTTQYNAGATGGLTDITTGAIYLVAHGNNSAVAQWSVDYSVRYKFYD